MLLEKTHSLARSTFKQPILRTIPGADLLNGQSKSAMTLNYKLNRVEGNGWTCILKILLLLELGFILLVRPSDSCLLPTKGLFSWDSGSGTPKGRGGIIGVFNPFLWLAMLIYVIGKSHTVSPIL